MEYDDTFNTEHAFAVDIGRWERRHRDFWTERLGRRYLLTVVPTRSHQGRILEIGAAWYNRYQKDVVGRDNELTVIDVKEPDHPEIVAIDGLDRYIRFDMTEDAERSAAAPSGCVGLFDGIRSWGVLSHYGFAPDQCRRYLDNVHRFLRPGGQGIFKLDIDTHKTVKQSPVAGVGFLEDLIRERFRIVHTDVLIGNTPGHVHYVEKPGG